MSSKKLFQYAEIDMENALRAIRHGGMAVATACRQFNVPRTSVRNRLSGKSADTCRRVGPQCVLGKSVEEKLVNWILDCAQRGFPLNKEGLIFSTQKLIEECGLENKLMNKKPGRKWFDSFMRRHPELSKKQAEFINKARASVFEERIRLWFQQTRDLLGPDTEILEHPERVFNMDETAFFLAPKGLRVLGPRGKHVYEVGKSDKENVTTLITVNAAGEFAPPLTIFKYQRLPKEYAKAAPPNWSIGTSDTGWMQSKQFFEYFANVFLKFLETGAIQRPVIVFLDGHASHLSLNLSNLCRDNGIILVCLPPNTTHILQPLDVALFFPLKQEWKKISRKWIYDHDGNCLQKKDIPAALHKILNEKDFSKTIAAGFRSCGLYPFDENAVKYERCIKKTKSKEDLDKNSSVENVHCECFNEHIDPILRQKFEETFATFQEWQGEERFKELYKVWKSVNECHMERNNQKSCADLISVSFDNNMQAISPLTDYDDNTMFIDFPEFNDNEDDDVAISVHVDSPERLKILENIVVKTADVNNDDSKNEIISSTEVGTCESIITNSKNSEMNEDNDAKEKEEEKYLRKKTISEVLRDVTRWPDDSKSLEKTKRKKNPMPSVITSDKWIEVLEANENAKLNKKKTNTKNQNCDLEIDETENDRNLRNCKKFKRNENMKEEQESSSTLIFSKGTFVIVHYENALYPAKILNVNDNQYYCCAMARSGNNWKWPEPPDLLWYDKDDIIKKIEEPKAANARGACFVPEMKYFET